MNPSKVNASIIFKLIVFTLCLAALLIGGSSEAGLTQSPAQRKLNPRTFKNMPLVIKEVRNLQKQETWFRDLEIEVQNTSDKPLYFISLIIEFPDIQAPPPTMREDGTTPSKSTTGFRLTYGTRRLMDVSKYATPEDISLKPGETYVFKIPEARIKGLEHMKREKHLSPDATNKIDVEFDIISFGDGTGYIAGKKRAHARQPKKNALRVSNRTSTAPTIRKANWAMEAPVVVSAGNLKPAMPQFGSCAGTGGCDQYYIEPDSDAFCVDSQSPPTFCERAQARVRAGEECSKYKVINFTCGIDQPCSDDAIDAAATLTCDNCPDEDEDGHDDINCGGDDCDDGDDTRHPGAGENCGDGIDNDCDDNTDWNDPLCSHCANAQWECNQIHGTFVPETCDCCCSPIVLDMAGDGIRLTNVQGGVRFDLNSDGTKERVSWTDVGVDEAWLALDRNGNSVIDNGQELFGDKTPQPQPRDQLKNGFLALAVYDNLNNGGNGDGVIDARDAIFSSLRLWRDTNHNGVSEAGELHMLRGLGLKSINLDYKQSKRTDQYGNRFVYRAKVIDVHGAQLGRWAWDVFLLTTP